MFELGYLGHAGWLIKNKELTILCDPWFNPSGAYFGEWKQFPDNSHLLTEVLLTDVDVIYISHIHDDHCDPWFLKQVDKKICVLIPRFKDKTLLKTLSQLGFQDIQELDRSETLKLNDVKIKIIEDEGYLDADSCLFLDDGNDKVLNLNDCHLDFSTLKNIVGEVDLLLLQSSSAIWWPCAYDYDDEKKNRFGKIKRQNILNRAIKYSKMLNAKNVIPNAGPPILMNDRSRIWNKNRRSDSNPFILMDDAHKHLIKNNINSHLPIPGSILFLQNASVTALIDEEELNNIYQKYENYLQKYEKQIGTIECDIPPKEEIDNIIIKFKTQLERIKKISKFYTKKINFAILFDFKYLGKWILDFEKDACFVKFIDQQYKYYFILDPEKIALLFQDKSIDFERYFLGCNFTCGRTPDEYNEFVFTLLKHFDTKRFLISESLYASRVKALDETFTLQHKGRQMIIQKYCPHMFADLEEVGFIDEQDNFVCPLHLT